MATPDQPLNPPTRLQSELIVCFVVSNRRTIEFPRVLLSCNRKRTPANLAQRARCKLYGEFADPFHRHSEDGVFVKAGCGKTARPVCAADGGQRESNRARLLRPDSCEAGEQSEEIHCGGVCRGGRSGTGGAKGGDQGKCGPAK